MILEKGAFVVLEGVDGSGKTEQAKLLTPRLKAQGIDSILTKTPGEVREGCLVGSSLGPVVREVMFNPDKYPSICYESKSLLLLADHVQLIEEVVKPAIKSKQLVISDRFMDSQFATWGKPAEDLINQTFSRFYKNVPDLTILLLAQPEDCYHRATHRSVVENSKQASKPWSSVENFKAIQDRYLEILVGHQSRNVMIVDTVDKTIDQVHEIIVSRLLEWLQRNHYFTNESVTIWKNTGTSIS